MKDKTYLGVAYHLETEPFCLLFFFGMFYETKNPLLSIVGQFFFFFVKHATKLSTHATNDITEYAATRGKLPP